MAPSTCCSASVGWASRRSAWSLCTASTTASKRSLWWVVCTRTPAASRSMRCTGAARRASSPCSSLATYWRAPPATVCHCGRSCTWISPWLWQKRTMVATGKRSIWSVGQLQMQPSMGRKYQSRNAAPKPCASRNSPSGCCSAASAPLSASAVHRRLKRSSSRSMPQKRGRSRLRRWANTVSRLAPLHSSAPAPQAPAPGTCTENDMSEGAVGMSSSANSAIRPG